jgi:MFS family permease
MRFGRFDYAAFLTFFVYAAGSVVTPVALVALAHDLNFSLEQGGMTAGGALQLGRTLAIVVAMLLCGFAAGRWGKRRTLGSSVILMGVGLGIAALSPAYGILFAALAVTGLGEGVIEGLATPLVQDLHPDEPGRHINFAHAFWPVGVLTTVLVSGALLAHGVSWRWITGMVAILSLVPAALLLVPVRAGGRAYPDHPEPLHWRTVRNQATTILRIPRFWIFYAGMFLAGGGEFCLTFWSASHIQLRYEASAWSGGIGTAGFAAGMMIGRIGSGYAIRQRHLKKLIVFAALGGTAVTLLLPFQAHLWAFFALLFLAGLATAPFWPSLQCLCTDRLPKVDTTMLLILLSCAGVPGCGFFTWLMGYLGNRSGNLGYAFLLVPGCYALIAALMGVDKLLRDPFPSPPPSQE